MSFFLFLFWILDHFVNHSDVLLHMKTSVDESLHIFMIRFGFKYPPRKTDPQNCKNPSNNFYSICLHANPLFVSSPIILSPSLLFSSFHATLLLLWARNPRLCSGRINSQL